MHDQSAQNARQRTQVRHDVGWQGVGRKVQDDDISSDAGRTQDGSTMRSTVAQAGRQHDDVNSDTSRTTKAQGDNTMTPAVTQAGTMMSAMTEAGHRMEVGRSSDESLMKIQRTSDKSRTCRAQPSLRRWQATALHCSSL
ncbi:unnamed protein product [Sphagnum balticum]